MTEADINFKTFSPDEIIDYLQQHFEEFGDGPVEEELIEKLRVGLKPGGVLRLDAMSEGFAVSQIQRLDLVCNKAYSKLLFLYVHPNHRGKKIGAQLVQQVLTQHVGNRPMKLECVGKIRIQFFQRLGFTFVAPYGDQGAIMHYVPVLSVE